MRLLHPKTIEILANHPEFPKTHLSHVWSEVFKYLTSGKKHPKMFIDNPEDIGRYMKYLYTFASKVACKFDTKKIFKLDKEIVDAFTTVDTFYDWHKESFNNYFDDNYLFSDAVSLYFKGTNIFPDIFGDEW